MTATKPKGTPWQYAEFMARAYTIELEATERYAQFAEQLETHNNGEVAALFRRLAARAARLLDGIDVEIGLGRPGVIVEVPVVGATAARRAVEGSQLGRLAPDALAPRRAGAALFAVALGGTAILEAALVRSLEGTAAADRAPRRTLGLGGEGRALGRRTSAHARRLIGRPGAAAASRLAPTLAETLGRTFGRPPRRSLAPTLAAEALGAAVDGSLTGRLAPALHEKLLMTARPTATAAIERTTESTT